MAAYTVRVSAPRGALVTPQAVEPAMAAARTPADWCRAAELQARYGGEVPIFTYPRGPVPPKSATGPWISRLLGCE